MTKVKFPQFIFFYSYALISEKNVNELCTVISFSIEVIKKNQTTYINYTPVFQLLNKNERNKG